MLVRTGSGTTRMPIGSGKGDAFSGELLRRSRSNSLPLRTSKPFQNLEMKHQNTLRGSPPASAVIRSGDGIHSRPTSTDKEAEQPYPDYLMRRTRITKKTDDFLEELAFSGGGGGGREHGMGTGGQGGGDRREDIGAYYEEMLRVDPENPLLLRNYGKFLDEVEGEVEKAEECYERAILAMPGDGEILSLYGDLVWRTHKDEQRAEDYFQRAVQASPNDSSVLGSYAHFLWDAEEEEVSAASSSAAAAGKSGPEVVAAF